MVAKAGFRAVGIAAGRLPSTAWMFQPAVHRVLATAQSMEAPPEGRIGWEEAFREASYSAIPNRRCAGGAAALAASLAAARALRPLPSAILRRLPPFARPLLEPFSKGL